MGLTEKIEKAKEALETAGYSEDMELVGSEKVGDSKTIELKFVEKRAEFGAMMVVDRKSVV